MPESIQLRLSQNQASPHQTIRLGSKSNILPEGSVKRISKSIYVSPNWFERNWSSQLSCSVLFAAYLLHLTVFQLYLSSERDLLEEVQHQAFYSYCILSSHFFIY